MARLDGSAGAERRWGGCSLGSTAKYYHHRRRHLVLETSFCLREQRRYYSAVLAVVPFLFVVLIFGACISDAIDSDTGSRGGTGTSSGSGSDSGTDWRSSARGSNERKCVVYPPFTGAALYAATPQTHAAAKALRSLLLADHCAFRMVGGNSPTRGGTTVLLASRSTRTHTRLIAICSNNIPATISSPIQYQRLRLRSRRRPQERSYMTKMRTNNAEDSVVVITYDVQQAIKDSPQQTTTYRPRKQRKQTPDIRLKRENPQQSITDTISDIGNDRLYRAYYSLPVLLARWNKTARDYASHVTLREFGKSIEGRALHVLRIGRTDEEGGAPRRMLVNAAQHAREWITPAVATYAAQRLATHAAKGEQPWADLLQKVEVLIVPMVNPDGYEYSRAVDRFWRKNRRPPPGQISNVDGDDNMCAGVDLNRNWPVDYGGPHSTSTFPCSDVYIGRDSLSEPESTALSKLLDLPGMRAHVDVHSYGQFVLGPYSHSYDEPANASLVRRVGVSICAAAARPFNIPYAFSAGADNDLYPVSGDLSDWAFFKGAMSFTAEVRPDFPGPPGFELPVKDIRPTCEEWFEAFTVLLKYAAGETIEQLQPAVNASNCATNVEGDPIPGAGSGLPGDGDGEADDDGEDNENDNDDGSGGGLSSLSQGARIAIWVAVAVVVVALAVLVVLFVLRRRRRSRRNDPKPPQSETSVEGEPQVLDDQQATPE